MKRVYLGGTCNKSEWRDQLIPMLKIDYFNPVVDDWTPECQAEEIKQRAKCDFLLYVITPRMTGVYSIVELVYDSCHNPAKTLFCIVPEDLGVAEFKEGQLKSLMMVSKMVLQCGAIVFDDLQSVADYLNESYIEIPYNPNLIECLIERDGPTEISLKTDTYLFEKNELNDYVCQVLSGDHRRHFLSLLDFRIYQEHLAPDKEFSDDEMSFKQQWERLSDDAFLAYVNGHIERFNSSSAKLRRVAIRKWGALLSHMSCPISLDGVYVMDDTFTGSEETLAQQLNPADRPLLQPTIIDGEKTYPVIMSEDPNPQSTQFDKEFYKEWNRHHGVAFERYVAENEQRFLDAPEDIYILAVEKWDKLVKPKTGKAWPFDEE